MNSELNQKLRETQKKFNKARVIFLILGLILVILMVLLRSVFILSLIIGLTLLFIIKIVFPYLRKIRRLKQLIIEESEE